MATDPDIIPAQALRLVGEMQTSTPGILAVRILIQRYRNESQGVQIPTEREDLRIFLDHQQVRELYSMCVAALNLPQ